MYILLDHGSLVQGDRVCGAVISTYNYKHNELHSCIKVQRAILDKSNLWICKFVPCNQIAYFKSFSYLSGISGT